ncbi:MAG: hypothetical protein AAB909_01155 [Patescibacteria group bacterium]
MFDEALNKGDFFDFFRKKGYSEEKIDEEWGKIRKVFTLNLMAAVYEQLPADQERALSFGLNLEKHEGVAKLLTKIGEYIESNSEKIDAKKAISRAIEITSEEYKELLRGKHLV